MVPFRLHKKFSWHFLWIVNTIQVDIIHRSMFTEQAEWKSGRWVTETHFAHMTVIPWEYRK